MKRQDWVWMPHPGHFICAEDCRFHLNTYVGGYIVSTVGEHLPDSAIILILHPELAKFKGDKLRQEFKKQGFEKIGNDRIYETMVFEASKRHIAPTESYSCCPYHITSGMDIEMVGYNTPSEAYEGHIALCEKWSKINR